MAEAGRDTSRRRVARAMTDARAVNGAAMRWTPGPDELRLPDCEAEPVSSNTRQLFVIVESVGTLRQHWRGRRDVFVGGDLFVYWHRGRPPVSPDVLVAFGVASRHHGSYVVWEEGKPPDFVLEVVSPSSGERDEKEKPAIYAEMGVPEYFWYDPKGELEPALAGFELCGCEYRPLPEATLPGGVVGIRSKVLGLSLCIKPSGADLFDCALRWYDPAAAEFLPTRDEWARGMHEAEARAEQEAKQRRAAEARVAELEAALRLRASPL